MHRIYLVRKDNKPVYVGYTSKTLEERWYRHCFDSINPKYALHHAIKKHGVDSFSIEILYESEDKEHTLNHMEHHYIWLYKTYKDHGGYNLTLGGEGCKKAGTMSKKEYQKFWCEANPEKVKAYAKDRWKSNKEKERSRTRAWREANPEKVKAYDKARREAKKSRS